MKETVKRIWGNLDRWSTYKVWWMLLAVVDFAISLVIVRLVPYTEIDWKAYCDEVSGPLVHGEWDYMKLKGDTGPLVYPAGFVYVFGLLYFLTDHGTNILRAQYIFAGLHSVLVYLVLGTVYYRKTGATDRSKYTSWWVGPLLILSRRVHSIFALRLFNDGVAMLFLFAATFVMVRQKWTLSVIMMTVALSIKMNIMLFVPGYAVILLEMVGLKWSIVYAIMFVGFQVAIAIPFLMVNPYGYLNRAFELGRVFMFKWTVNFKFLPEEIFVSKEFALMLLGMTLLTWLLFGNKHFAASHKNGLFGLILGCLTNPNAKPLEKLRFDDDLTHHIILTMFTSNFIGIAFARSIHYQFYSWYWHTLGYLVFSTNVNLVIGATIVGAIEVVYNIFPATPASSAVLQVSHILLLNLLWFTKPQNLLEAKKKTK